MMLLSELLRDITDREITGQADVVVKRVVADSRITEPEDVFVAVRGTAIDGHDKVLEALEKGATVIVGERHINDVHFDHHHSASEITYVRVKNSRTAHAAMLRASRPDIRAALDEIAFYGVTGTNGKTTVATVLEQALRHLGVPVGFLGTTGYRFGDEVITATHTTPDVDRLYELIVQMHKAGVKTIVMEVSSHALDQERVDGIPFKAALFTNLTRDHLDYHETMEEYAEAKQKLFSGLAPSSIAILNGADKWSTFMKRGCTAERIITVDPPKAQTDLNGCHYTVEGMEITSPMIGEFNVINTALCAVLLKEAGHSAEQVQAALAVAVGPEGRMEQHLLKNGALAVIDYAHTPDALDNALQVLRPLLPSANARLHVVFGCGGDRDKGKRPAMGRIAGERADVIWITSDNPRTEEPGKIIDEIVAGLETQIAGSSMTHVIEDRREAIEAAISDSSEGDIILIAGKGHEKVQVIGTERHHFSDAEVVRESEAAES